jgi:guanine deaminase
VPQLAVCGVHPESLLSWLRRWIYRLESEFRGARARKLCRDFVADMLAEGTTTAALYTSAWPDSVDACFAAAARAGVHAWIGMPLMDVDAYRPVSTRLVLDEAELFAKMDRPRLRFAVTPRFALSCTRELLEGAGDLARRRKLPIQTHLAETKPECAEVRRRFRRGYVDVYQKAGLVGRRSLFAHAVWLKPRDWRKIARSAVAHCPTSNLFLASGQMDWDRAQSCRVALASDVGAGPHLSIFQVARAAWMVHDAEPPPAELLWAATLGGAKALGFADVGSLEKGKAADFLALDRRRIVPSGAPDLESTEDLLSRVLHRAARSAILSVHVSGRKVC